MGLRAPGMFIDLLKRTVARTGGTLAEVPTHTTKLSQFCHGCGQFISKPLGQRWHSCACGVSAQRDLYSAFLAAFLDPPDFLPSCAQPRYAASWEGREPGLRAAYEVTLQRASAGQPVPRSFGIPGARRASASKSKPSDTRARLPRLATGNVEAEQGTSGALARRGLRIILIIDGYVLPIEPACRNPTIWQVIGNKYTERRSHAPCAGYIRHRLGK